MATQVAISGTLKDAEGNNLSGTVTFTPTQPLVDSAGTRIVGTAPVVATLSSGTFTITVYATDDATTMPDGATYTVTEDLTGTDGTPIPRTFRCEIPSASPTLRYEDLVEVQSRPSYSYATSATAAALTESVNEVRTQTPVGTAVVAIGESHVQGLTHNDSLVSNSNPSLRSWFNQACWRSGGRWVLKRNAGVSGNTTAQMVARFATDVTAYVPDVVVIQGGTNDTALTVAETLANIQLMIDYTRAIPALPILCTEIPRNSANADRLSQINNGIRDKALRQGISVIDFARSFLTVASDGTLDPAYTDDAVHLITSAAIQAADEIVMPVIDAVSPRAGSGLLLLPDWDDDPSNMLTGACFAGSVTNNAPEDWTFARVVGATGTPASTTGCTVVAAEASDGLVGQWYEITFANFDSNTADAGIEVLQSIDSGLWDPSDRVLVGFALDMDLTGDLEVSIGIKIPGPARAGPVNKWPAMTYRGTPHIFTSIASTASGLNGSIFVEGFGSNSGTLRVGMFILANCETLGWGDLFP